MLERILGRKEFRYKCSQCGKTHVGSPSFAYRYPTYYFDVPEDEREKRVRATEDLCQIDPSSDEDGDATIYCIRVILEIPIKGAKEPFTWGVWVTQSKESFEKYVDTFDEDQSSQSSFGWLPVTMPFYKSSEAGAPFEHLECDVHWGSPGQRPKACLWESEHPLAVDQRSGISWQKASEMANLISGCQ
nr:DUF2199 domain-containing protein [Ruegeria lacuscaerulensis]